MKLPGSFVPDEDQGYMLVDVQLPAGATVPRTREVMQRISAILMSNPAVANVFIIVGSSFTGNGGNAGRAFVHLKPWDERKPKAAELIRWANMTFAREIHDARAYVINLPTIRGLGAFGGSISIWRIAPALAAKPSAAPKRRCSTRPPTTQALTSVRANLLSPSPQLNLTVDRVQAQSMGLSASDVYTALQLMLAPVYANDFIYQGRVLRVLLQADAPTA